MSHNNIIFDILAALSITVTVSLFILLGIDHPPAVGMTLGLVLESWTLLSISIFLLSILALALCKLYIWKHDVHIMK